jgi:hypothetical protein
MSTHQAGRHFLQIPGPTNCPLPVLAAIAQPTIDHRGPRFKELAAEVLAGVRAIFKTGEPVVIYPASGTGAWEAALVNAPLARRCDPDVRDRMVLDACGRRLRKSSGSPRKCCRATGGRALMRMPSEPACARTGAI